MGFIKELRLPTPEDMANIQKERALSDAELIQGGAEYVVNEDGIRLHPTDEQINNARKEVPANKEKPIDSTISSILDENLDSDTAKQYSEFLNQIPQDLKENGLKNSILSLCLRIKMAENILDEKEIKIFKQMLNNMSPLKDMIQGELTDSWNKNLAETYHQAIEIPDDIAAGKNRIKFILKLQSVGFDISKRGQFGNDTELHHLHLELLKSYDQ